MKHVFLSICMLALIVQTSFAGSDAKTSAATKLLNVMGIKSALEQSMEQMLNLQIQQNPTLQPFRAVMLKFFNKHMSYESLKTELAPIYAEAFTAKELDTLTSFYQTPTGQKAIKKMPELMAKGGQLGAARVQQNLPELQRMIQEEAARIEKGNQ